MALTRSEVQVLWSSANSVSVGAASNATSDAFSVDATAIGGSAQLKADNDGTAAAGDTVDFFLLGTLGDPDGASTDEYGTGINDTWIATLNTASPGTDPAECVVPINHQIKGGKIYARNNSAARAITVSCTLYFQLYS